MSYYLYDGNAISIDGQSSVSAYTIKPIQGTPISVIMEVPESETYKYTDVNLKEIILSKLVAEMMGENYIEFTKQVSPIDFVTRIRARVFCVPNGEVQLLRLNEIIK